jgi:S-adenosylmethionine:tRNA ribosyltransferase-isomerase
MDPHHIDGYDYDLPPELIAHQPSPDRAGSRLLICEGEQRRLEPFGALVEALRPGDLLVFNDARVVPCRLYGRKESGARLEIFVLSPLEGGWAAPLEGEVRVSALVRSNKPALAGTRLRLEGPQEATATLTRRREDGAWEVALRGQGSLLALLEGAGQVPLPPYITSRRRALGEAEAQPEDRERYQTVYARSPGAVAAPTAGLHFTPALLEALQARGVEAGFLTLHVGIGTFKPLGEGPLEGQALHAERYEVGEALVAQVAAARARGGRVVAVGTTSARALEDQAARWGAPALRAGAWETSIFIKPGHRWGLVEGLVTNLHLPRSSLLVLVGALMGYAPMRAAYAEAVAQTMRFYSYGDAMLVWRQGGQDGGAL